MIKTRTAIAMLMMCGFIVYAMETNAMDFVDAIIAVESNGDDNAFNVKENAAGCMQIRQCYVEDVNKIVGKKLFKLEDRFDRDSSLYMFSIYTAYYCKKANIEVTYENMARIHNGGPDGWKKKSTIEYWNRIRKEMNK